MWILLVLLGWLALTVVTATVVASACAAGRREDVWRGFDAH